MPDLPAQLRAACQAVAADAQHVCIDRKAIGPYSASLAGSWEHDAGDRVRMSPGPAERERRIAETLTLDAINFGSGWFPTLRKRPGLSGYRTIAAGLSEQFTRNGPWSAGELSELKARELAGAVGQDPHHELIALFADSLNDLGQHLVQDHDGAFTSLVDSADGSALRFVAELAGWASFTDVSHYGELKLPFLKRAQIVAADLQRAGAASFDDLHRLTIFADNLVPHVLTLDGVLHLSDELRAAIASETLLEHGSRPEVELRACAVHACELLVGELNRSGAADGVTAAQLDTILWERGGTPFYKASPRPRSRCTAY